MFIWVAFLQGNSSSQNIKDINLKKMLLLSLGNPVFHTALHGKPLYLLQAREKHKDESENWSMMDLQVLVWFFCGLWVWGGVYG